MVLAHSREWLKALGRTYWLGFALGLLAYAALGAAGKRFSPFAALDFAGGFALALILAHGARYWSVVFLGSVLLGLRQHAGWALSLGDASLDTAAALLAAVQLVRYADFRMELARMRDALAFPFVAVMLGALAVAEPRRERSLRSGLELTRQISPPSRCATRSIGSSARSECPTT